MFLFKRFGSLRDILDKLNRFWSLCRRRIRSRFCLQAGELREVLSAQLGASMCVTVSSERERASHILR